MSWAREALRGRGGRGGAARECDAYADLRLGVDTTLFDLRRARDELLLRSFGVFDLLGMVDVIVEVAEGILGGGEAQLGALISLYWDSQPSGRVSFVYTPRRIWQKGGQPLFSGSNELLPWLWASVANNF